LDGNEHWFVFACAAVPDFPESAAASARSMPVTYFEFYLHEHRLTLRELSKRTGMPDPLLSEIKNGRVVPRPGEVERIADALHVPASLLMREVPVPPLVDREQETARRSDDAPGLFGADDRDA
jgi:transcriptional regulator with XRE-family HTH domain